MKDPSIYLRLAVACQQLGCGECCSPLGRVGRCGRGGWPGQVGSHVGPSCLRQGSRCTGTHTRKCRPSLASGSPALRKSRCVSTGAFLSFILLSKRYVCVCGPWE